MSGTRPRDGARHFSLAAREAVAAGDPFNHLHKGEFRRRSDDRDLLAALLLAEGKADDMKGLTAGGGYAATCLGFDPEGYVGKRAIRELCDLGQHADMGGCRTPEALRRALLGEGSAATAVTALAARGGDGAFSEDGC
jgi:hypothetical protein